MGTDYPVTDAQAQPGPLAHLLGGEEGIEDMPQVLLGYTRAIIGIGSTLLLSVSVPPDFVCLVTRNSLDAMELSLSKQTYITFKASDVNIF